MVAAKVADLGGYNLSSDAASVVLPRALGGTSGSVVVIAWEEPPVAPPPAGLTTQAVTVDVRAQENSKLVGNSDNFTRITEAGKNSLWQT